MARRPFLNSRKRSVEESSSKTVMGHWPIESSNLSLSATSPRVERCGSRTLIPLHASWRLGLSSYTFRWYVLVRLLTRHHRNARIGRERNRWSSWHRTTQVGRKDDYVRTGRQIEPIGATGWDRFAGGDVSWKGPEVLTSSTIGNPLNAAPQHDHGPCRMPRGGRCSLKIAVARADLSEHDAIGRCYLGTGWR